MKCKKLYIKPLIDKQSTKNKTSIPHKYTRYEKKGKIKEKQ